jgi:hypothetical protein
MVALTIGMATYDDFDGVYFTLQALRMYQDVADTEFVVVDNFGCEHTKTFVEHAAGGRYVLATDLVGTAAAKNLVFAHATGEAVLVCDSHVLFWPGAIARLKAYYRDHPRSRDLLQGPLVYDDLATISTHFDPVWRGQMWGIWATDPRGLDPEGEPFEIPSQGMGVFSCRRLAWPGFNPAFRGFGGEEGYIHEKMRQRGGRALCLPWLRWVHRFGRPKGVPYPLTVDDKLRNYLIGFAELGLDLQPVLDHFGEHLPDTTIAAIKEAALRDLAATMPPPAPEPEPDEPPPAPERPGRGDRAARRLHRRYERRLDKLLGKVLPDTVRAARGEPVARDEDDGDRGGDAKPRDPAVAREDARRLLLGQGWLDDRELADLPTEEAIGLALRRAHDGVARLEPFPGAAAVNDGVAIVAGEEAAAFNVPPLVSCLCPTYGRPPDHQELLEEAIESFLRQTYPNKELIVLNDCAEQELVCDAPGVRVVNVRTRFATLGDKYNAAVAIARGDLLAPWEDDDISLPWRLALSVERLGDAGYYNPKRYVLLDGSGFHADQPMGYGHNLSLFSREAFGAVGGYRPISGAQDAEMDGALVAAVAGRGGPWAGEPELPRREWFYIYRWGVSPTHLSAAAAPEELYRRLGSTPAAPGRFTLRPHWREDYVAAVADLLAGAGVA